jgi:hypothetical protein
VSALKTLVPYYIKPTGRVFAVPGFFYLVDTSGLPAGTNVVFMMPPSASCTPGDRMVIKKITSDSAGIAVTPWNTENLNAANAASVISTLNTSHMYVPGCPSTYGGQPGWVSF